ncbi:MAG: WYL domain-containing protein [Succinivibrionaceae bacterium]|nr:WYL domain-containing protein [Succinivibrionaceae bacterium]
MGAKLDDASRTEKALTLLSMFLFGKREYSMTELREHLNTSRATVLRIIEDLRNFNSCQIRNERRGRESFYSIERPRGTPDFTFSADSIMQLSLCQTFMRHLLPAAVRRDLETGIQSLARSGQPGLGEAALGVGSSYAKGSIDYSGCQEQMRVLMSAIASNRICRVEYQARLRVAAKSYLFAPRLILAYHEVLYALGYVVTDTTPAEPKYSNSIKLMVHRIKSAEPDPRSSDLVPRIEFDDRAFGLLDDGETFRAQIHFDPDAAPYVYGRHWSSDQEFAIQRDGSVVLTLSCRSASELISWVQSFGPRAKVLSPRSLAQQVASSLSFAAARYKDLEEY